MVNIFKFCTKLIESKESRTTNIHLYWKALSVLYVRKIFKIGFNFYVFVPVFDAMVVIRKTDIIFVLQYLFFKF